MMSRPSKRTVVIVCTVLLCLWLGVLSLVGWAMRQPPETFGRVMQHMPGPVFLLFPFETMWTHARKGTLQPGEMAPDFVLKTQDHEQEVSLSSFRDKQPVVLVFGSYT